MNMELIKEIFSIVGACFTLAILFILMLLFIYLVISYTMLQNDKEIDYLNSLNDEDKKVIEEYKLARSIKFKELFSLLRRKKGKAHEDK